MKASISGNNGTSKVCLSLGTDLTSHLFAGLNYMKVKIEGDVVNGLRLIADPRGVTVRSTEGRSWIEVPTKAVGAVAEPVCQVDLAVEQERDENGPILKTQPFPVVFAPKDRKAIARRRLEAWAPKEPKDHKIAAESLFRSRTTVRRTHQTAEVWAFENVMDNGVIVNRVARLACSLCPATVEISQKTIFPPDQIAKKFKEKGWWIKHDKVTCPTCQHVVLQPKDPVDIVAVIDTVQARRMQGTLIDQLKTVLADANRILEEIGDPTIRLELVKNRVGCYKKMSL